MAPEAVRPCRVLVIDDAADVAVTLAALVESLGHKAEFLTDPRKGVERAKQYRPELVLLDIGMPHISGYELAPMLRAALAPDPVAIVAVTAWGTQEDKQHAHQFGFDEHLRKPVEISQISKTIEKLC
jgi:CheY-like chemotaxis protein